MYEPESSRNIRFEEFDLYRNILRYIAIRVFFSILSFTLFTKNRRTAEFRLKLRTSREITIVVIAVDFWHIKKTFSIHILTQSRRKSDEILNNIWHLIPNSVQSKFHNNLFFLHLGNLLCEKLWSYVNSLMFSVGIKQPSFD